MLNKADEANDIANSLNFVKRQGSQRQIAICYHLWSDPAAPNFDEIIKYHSRNMTVSIQRLRTLSDVNDCADIFLFLDDRIPPERVNIPGCIVESKPFLIPEAYQSYQNFTVLYTNRFTTYAHPQLADYDFIILLDGNFWMIGEHSFEHKVGQLDEDIHLYCYQHDLGKAFREEIYQKAFELTRKGEQVDGQRHLDEYMLKHFQRLHAPPPGESPIFPFGGFQICRNNAPEIIEFARNHIDFIMDDEVLLDIWKYGYEKPLGRANEIIPESWAPTYEPGFTGFVQISCHPDQMTESK